MKQFAWWLNVMNRAPRPFVSQALKAQKASKGDEEGWPSGACSEAGAASWDLRRVWMSNPEQVWARGVTDATPEFCERVGECVCVGVSVCWFVLSVQGLCVGGLSVFACMWWAGVGGEGQIFGSSSSGLSHMLEVPCPLRSIFGLDKEPCGGVPVSGRGQSRPPWRSWG